MTDVTVCDISKQHYQRPRNSIFNTAAKRLLILLRVSFSLSDLLNFCHFDMNPSELLKCYEQNLYFNSQKVQRQGPETKSRSEHATFIMNKTESKTPVFKLWGFFPKSLCFASA